MVAVGPFPADNIIDIVSNIAGSPIKSLSVQCYEDDIIEICSILHATLAVNDNDNNDTLSSSSNEQST
ncbi:hypothetical protein PTI98_012332 [Pleurotus ostreatus]|nr:hypothetical protein PTI98_012332 [Pleurotus ostreatus]